jgi:hypothetical protein
MTPRFRCGQTVRLSRGLRYRSAADGEYKIIRQLPDNDGELQYRVKSVSEPHERVFALRRRRPRFPRHHGRLMAASGPPQLPDGRCGRPSKW